MTCKFCGAETEGLEFCSLEHKLEQDIIDLKSENISLEQRIRLLNCQRTQIWPDKDKTLDQNVLDAEAAFHQYVHEMSSDEILLLMKKAEAIAAACWLVVQKKGIKDTNSARVEKQVKQAEVKREDDKARSPLELAKIKFVRDAKAQGFSEQEANKLWVKESAREKAVQGFMQSLRLSREKAEAMVNAIPGMQKESK